MIYAMSDIHGCYDKYRAMLSEIRFKSTDTLGLLSGQDFGVWAHAHQLLCGQDKIFRSGTMINIDCGCAFPGGRLGCLCLDTMEEYYV